MKVVIKPLSSATLKTIMDLEDPPLIDGVSQSLCDRNLVLIRKHSLLSAVVCIIETGSVDNFGNYFANKDLESVSEHFTWRDAPLDNVRKALVEIPTLAQGLRVKDEDFLAGMTKECEDLFLRKQLENYIDSFSLKKKRPVKVKKVE